MSRHKCDARVTQYLTALSRTSIDGVLELVYLEHHAHQLVSEYSSGMRQRLGLWLAAGGRGLCGGPC